MGGVDNTSEPDWSKRMRSEQLEGVERRTKATKSHDTLAPIPSYPSASSWYGMTGMIKE